jgi:uridine kinase
MPYVVAIAGPAGGGKSSLLRQLVAALGDATAIQMDSYQRFTREPIREIVQWMQRGADFNEFAIASLAEHLEALKRGAPVLDPLTRLEIPARKYILFETHFGRAHRHTGQLIDLLIWIDAPLDIALARNVKDLVAAVLRGCDAGVPRERVAGIQEFLESYLEDVRRLRLMQREKVAAGADVTLDGSRGLDAMTQHALAQIRARLP